MKNGAMILGILAGLFSLGYVGFFGGLLGSMMSWGDPSSMNGGLLKLVCFGLPILALVGAGMSGGNPKIGGLLLGASAIGHLLLLGVGVIGLLFAIPIGIASGLALASSKAVVKAEGS